MITLKDALNYAVLKGKKYEIDAPQTYKKYAWDKDFINPHNSELYYDFKIGINFSDGIWVWFKAFGVLGTKDLNIDMPMHFHERYSQMNGKSIKGWKTGYRFEQKITEVTKNLF